MRTVLITGGAGFIGSNLCSHFLNKGFKVVAVDNFATSGRENIKSLSKKENFVFIKHDISKPLPKNISQEVSKDTPIFHLACPTGVPNLVKMAEEMLDTCSNGTKNILELARKKNSKVIFASSSEVYGNPLTSPQSEEYNGNVSPVDIRSPYEEGKRFSESLIMMYVRKYKVNARIVRIFNTYGPGMSKNDTRVIATFLRNALNNKPLPVAGDGIQKRTFCYVDDLVSALVIVWKRGKKGGIYNAGGDEKITIKKLATLIKKITKSESKIKFIKRPSHDHQSRMPELTKIKELGWKQKTGLYEGIAKTLENYP